MIVALSSSYCHVVNNILWHLVNLKTRLSRVVQSASEVEDFFRVFLLASEDFSDKTILEMFVRKELWNRTLLAKFL